MSRIVAVLPVVALSCIAARAAALVPVPTVSQPSLPGAGFEANRGQANAGILFLSPASGSSIAVTAQSVFYSPLGATLTLVASNPNPMLSFSDTLPGLVNSYTGSDPAKWVTGIPRYATASLAAIYPGIDAQYTVDSGAIVTLHLIVAPGANLNVARFSIPQAVSIYTSPNGSVTAKFGAGNLAPLLSLAAAASQTGPAGKISPRASFTVQSATSFALSMQGMDSTLPLQIAIPLNANSYNPPYVAGSSQHATDALGNIYYAIPVADAAGKAAPFSNTSGTGCGVTIQTPVPCRDAAIYKYSAAGALEFITYLEGGVDETPGFIGIAPDGAVAVAGTTDSADFPVTAGAFQTAYAGPPATGASGSGLSLTGDTFAAILDSATGHLRTATFLGGPNADTMGTAALGNDGSLYFLPDWRGQFSAQMPVTPGALLSSCQSNPCQNGYAARLSPALDKLMYGTYLPGISQATAQLYSDGSVYYAGTAESGFPVTSGAYQMQNVGGYDGIIARLDPSGSKLLFATYFGGPQTDWILGIALGPDGSVWANVSSFIGCCVNIQSQVIHLDASGSRLIASVPISADAMVVDAAGNLITLAEGSVAVSPGAILGGSCGGPVYLRLSPTGQQLFATYLPGGSQIGFDGSDAQGDPYLDTPSGRVRVVENQPAPPSVGCVVDSASFAQFNPAQISPGAMMTLFGSGMGPSQGAVFQLTNGQLPTSLGGTRVTVNGEPAPLLYASHGQVNVVLPYDLPVGATAAIQVVVNGIPLNQLSNLQVVAGNISIFQVNGAAVALNQDYTVNSPQNPAQPGSTVALFGTGGGQTSPSSVAGEVTPLELRPLVITPQAGIIQLQPPAVYLDVEYAGAAPTLLSGVDQINVTLPATIPVAYGYPPGTVSLQVFDPGKASYQVVTIYAVPPAPNPTAGAAR
jgi:uncharacterized protein (TIGR03437 family)